MAYKLCGLPVPMDIMDRMAKKYRTYIGIDPGVNTGYAIWDRERKQLIKVESRPIHRAMLAVLNDHTLYPGEIFVRVEDARLRKWFGKEHTTVNLQGAGSIKRDAKIWEDFLKDYKIPFEMVHPKNTKFKADYFKQLTGWAGATNEHGRDAALLVFGK